jgi:hypothetical protein
VGLLAPTHINDRHVHAEGVGREIGNISHVVTPIENGGYPMSDSRPNGYPSDELGIYIDDALRDGNIIDSVVEQ